MPYAHDIPAIETLEIIAIKRQGDIHVVAGTAKNGNDYIRTFDCTESPPRIISTVKHGNAYGYIIGLGGFIADGIA